ncbi:hypothetical protein C8F01DRAFT_1083245 [Mycena amicta]|nr:hypothetical protein C8F01DRAFT_1083245 [Mycena amicta]
MYNFVLDSSLRRPSFGIKKDTFVEMAWQVQPIGVHLNLKGNKQFGGNIFIEDILKSARSNLAQCTLLFDNFLSCAIYVIASPTHGKTTSADATSWETCSKQRLSHPISPSMVILSHTFAAETLFTDRCLRSVAELIRLIATDGSALSGQSYPSGSCPWRQTCPAESCTLVTCVRRRRKWSGDGSCLSESCTLYLPYSTPQVGWFQCRSYKSSLARHRLKLPNENHHDWVDVPTRHDYGTINGDSEFGNWGRQRHGSPKPVRVDGFDPRGYGCGSARCNPWTRGLPSKAAPKLSLGANFTQNHCNPAKIDTKPAGKPVPVPAGTGPQPPRTQAEYSSRNEEVSKVQHVPRWPLETKLTGITILIAVLMRRLAIRCPSVHLLDNQPLSGGQSQPVLRK